MSSQFPRWVFPIVISALAAGCSGSAGGNGTNVPLPQPSSKVPTSQQAPRYFNPASNAAGSYICLPGITTTAMSCASPLKQPTQWIQVFSYSFGDDESVGISGGMVVTGRSNLSYLSFIKYADTTTPLAELALYTGRPITSDARFIETRTGATSTLPFDEIDMKSAVVVSDQLSGSGSVVESLSLNYNAMQYAYQPLLSSGLTGPVFKKDWDIVTNTADYTPATVLPPAGTPGLVPATRTASVHTTSMHRPITVPDGLVRALANKAHLPVQSVYSVLSGNYTQLLIQPGFKGTSTVPGYTNASELLSFSLGASNGGGTPSGQPITVQKPIDLNSTTLWGFVAASAPYSVTGPVELDLVDTTVSPSQKAGYFQFGTPYPESYQVSGSSGAGGDTESLSIFYAQIKFCVIPYTGGVAGNPVCQTWNFLTNQPT